MFNKKIFSNILQRIVNEYTSISEFAEKSEVNRTYLSKYINMKLDNPPTPKILEKIATTSNDITTYFELMEVCGYLNVYNSESINIYTNTNIQHNKPTFFLDAQYEDNLSNEEYIALQEICEIFKNCLKNNTDINWENIKIQPNLLYNNLSNKHNIDNYIQLILESIQSMKFATKNSLNYKIDTLGNPVVEIPLLRYSKSWI